MGVKNILIVDDSALMRRVLSDIINSDEELHNDKYATNGVEALEMLESGMKYDADRKSTRLNSSHRL